MLIQWGKKPTLPGSRKRSWLLFFVRPAAFSYCIGVRSLRSAESPVRGRRKRPCRQAWAHGFGASYRQRSEPIGRCANHRSETALSQTAIRYGRYLKTIARNILPSEEDAEEVLNDVYLAAWESIPPEKPRIFKYYLSRITRNLCFKRIEYRSAEKRCGNAEVLLSELEDCIPDNRKNPEEALEARMLGRSLNAFLAGLCREERKLFLSRYYYARTAQQLAEEYGCSPRQIKYRLEKLRGKLKHHLEKEGIPV